MNLTFGMNLNFGVSECRPATITDGRNTRAATDRRNIRTATDRRNIRTATDGRNTRAAIDGRNTRAAFILSWSKDECGQGGGGAGYSPRLMTMLSGPRDSTASAGSS